MTRPDMSIKVERKLHFYAHVGQNRESTKYGTIRMASFVYNILQRYVIPDPEFLSEFC